jgi:hypothetical protein
MQRSRARAPYFADDKEHVRRVLIGQRLDGRNGALAGLREPWVTQPIRFGLTQIDVKAMVSDHAEW